MLYSGVAHAFYRRPRREECNSGLGEALADPGDQHKEEAIPMSKRLSERMLAARPQAITTYRELMIRKRQGAAEQGDALRLREARTILQSSGGIPSVEYGLLETSKRGERRFIMATAKQNRAIERAASRTTSKPPSLSDDSDDGDESAQ